MTLLSVVIAYLILRWYGAAKPLHHDGWYYRWCEWLANPPVLARTPLSAMVLAILGPVIALVLLLILASSIWYWLQLFIAVPVLLYSVGRGKYAGIVMRYGRARQQQDWVGATACHQSLGMPDQGELDRVDQDDWAGLDQRMMMAVSYRGFERIFAVLFWFVLLGPAGALIYRLSTLYLQAEPGQQQNHDSARYWLWLLEWPAARVLGLSFALTGNFVGCIQAWRDHLWSTAHGTAEVLYHAVLGALQVDEALPASADTTEREFKAVLSLFSRTVIFWLCVLAVITVLL
ncbi:MAG: hypothetical protein WDZ30_06675 [Cellvibrionaceae bacterium]